eukprot:10581486-Ditylum_brightwellii.AAC.1
MAPIEVDRSELNKQEKTRIQQVLGTLLLYTRAVDLTMLMPSMPLQQTRNIQRAKQQQQLFNS